MWANDCNESEIIFSIRLVTKNSSKKAWEYFSVSSRGDITLQVNLTMETLTPDSWMGFEDSSIVIQVSVMFIEC